jgi:hypothetical protein
MPLSPIAGRTEAHARVIEMRAFARGNGLYDVEGHLVDRKPFAFLRAGDTVPLAPGAPMHDLWVRLTVDGDFVVRGIEAASDVTPYAICKQAEATLQVLVGERLARGWSSKVKERLRGAAGCTHLTEMLVPLATTAFQAIHGLRPVQERTAGASALVDTCYAYDRGSEVVRRLAPERYEASPTSKG